MIRHCAVAFAFALASSSILAGTQAPSPQQLLKLAPPPALSSEYRNASVTSADVAQGASQFVSSAREINGWRTEIIYRFDGGKWAVESMSYSLLPASSSRTDDASLMGSEAAPSSGSVSYETIQDITPPNVPDPNAPGPTTPVTPGGSMTNTWWGQGWTFRAVYRWGVDINGVLGWHVVEWSATIGPVHAPPPPSLQ
jgi:hypothetical protein